MCEDLGEDMFENRFWSMYTSSNEIILEEVTNKDIVSKEIQPAKEKKMKNKDKYQIKSRGKNRNKKDSGKNRTFNEDLNQKLKYDMYIPLDNGKT